MKKILAALALTLALAGFGLGRATAGNQGPIRVRWCPEDAIHVGTGDFNGTRWDHYQCIARDDF